MVKEYFIREFWAFQGVSVRQSRLNRLQIAAIDVLKYRFRIVFIKMN